MLHSVRCVRKTVIAGQPGMRLLADDDWLGGQDDDSSEMIKGLWDAVLPGLLARYTNHLSPDYLELTRALDRKFGACVAKRPGHAHRVAWLATKRMVHSAFV